MGVGPPLMVRGCAHGRAGLSTAARATVGEGPSECEAAAGRRATAVRRQDGRGDEPARADHAACGGLRQAAAQIKGHHTRHLRRLHTIHAWVPCGAYPPPPLDRVLVCRCHRRRPGGHASPDENSPRAIEWVVMAPHSSLRRETGVWCSLRRVRRFFAGRHQCAWTTWAGHRPPWLPHDAQAVRDGSRRRRCILTVTTASSKPGNPRVAD